MEILMQLLEEEEIDAWSAEEEEEVDMEVPYATDLASQMLMGADDPDRGIMNDTGADGNGM
jgi:hypothetical protein